MGISYNARILLATPSLISSFFFFTNSTFLVFWIIQALKIKCTNLRIWVMIHTYATKCIFIFLSLSNLSWCFQAASINLWFSCIISLKLWWLLWVVNLTTPRMNRSWDMKTTCLWSGSCDWKTQDFDPNVEAGWHMPLIQILRLEETALSWVTPSTGSQCKDNGRRIS